MSPGCQETEGEPDQWGTPLLEAEQTGTSPLPPARLQWAGPRQQCVRHPQEVSFAVCHVVAMIDCHLLGWGERPPKVRNVRAMSTLDFKQ